MRWTIWYTKQALTGLFKVQLPWESGRKYNRMSWVAATAWKGFVKRWKALGYAVKPKP